MICPQCTAVALIVAWIVGWPLIEGIAAFVGGEIDAWRRNRA